MESILVSVAFLAIKLILPQVLVNLAHRFYQIVTFAQALLFALDAIMELFFKMVNVKNVNKFSLTVSPA